MASDGTPRRVPRLVIAGTHSGVGKTTVALALMAALRRRGLVVQPFKVGPDFIDPGHHMAACGRASRNLDTWMLTDEAVRAVFDRAAADADVAVIEGVMGLFDGRSTDDPRGSTADLARLLDAPILLVVDAAAMAASAAAVVKGFAEFDVAVRVAAVLCNRVAGPRHYAYLEPPIRQHTRVACVGWLPRRPEWQIPERHLGLWTRADVDALSSGLDFEPLAKELEASVAVDQLLELAGPRWTRRTFAAEPAASGPARIAVAQDAAFCFYYADNLDVLRAAGAEIVPFSPLADAALPPGVDLVYLGGGYPELHAARLAANHEMRASLRTFHRQGGALYAECGGLMYCGRDLVDTESRSFPMLDLLPVRTVMQPRRAALGYVTWQAMRPTLFGPPGVKLRGHEFHYSRLEPLGPLQPAALLHRDGEEPRPDGFVGGGLLAGYAHLHFGSRPEAARHVVEQLIRPKLRSPS
jgi:cobyrinic acid a,c-diamide synthase